MSKQNDNSNKDDNQVEEDYICGECGMTFTSSDQLTIHYRNSHYQDWQATRRAV